MARLGFNANDVAPSEGGGPLPPGEYEMHVIEESLEQNSKGTGEILKLTYEVLGPSQAGRRMWVILNVVNANPVAQKIGQEELSALCHATGQMEVEDIPVVATPAAGAVSAGNVPAVDGSASDALVAAVTAEVTPDERRPIADFVTVSPAQIVHYSIDALLRVGPGADPGMVKAAALSRLQAQADRQHRPGAAQLLQMLYGAAYVADSTGAIIVEEVVLNLPAADVNADPITPAAPAAAYRAPYCDSITVTVEVVND